MPKSTQNEYNRNGLNVRIVAPLLTEEERTSAELKIVKALKLEFDAMKGLKKNPLQ